MNAEDFEVGELLAEENPRAELYHVRRTNSKRAPTQNTVTAAYQLTGWRKWALIVAAGALAAGAVEWWQRKLMRRRIGDAAQAVNGTAKRVGLRLAHAPVADCRSRRGKAAR